MSELLHLLRWRRRRSLLLVGVGIVACRWHLLWGLLLLLDVLFLDWDGSCGIPDTAHHNFAVVEHHTVLVV